MLFKLKQLTAETSIENKKKQPQFKYINKQRPVAATAPITIFTATTRTLLYLLLQILCVNCV